MDNKQIFSYIDHTLLSPTASESDIEKLCTQADKYQTASVCIPPCYIKFARSLFPNLNIGTVIGFPLGYDTVFTKATALQTALKDTADEFDMVINLTDVKNGRYGAIMEEIKVLKQLAPSKILKVICETCYLTEIEKITLCKAVTDAGADYIKTSTGFGTAGATLEDIILFRENVGKNVKIKAAGGIKTREDMIDFINAGADRLGTSSGIKILCDNGKAGDY